MVIARIETTLHLRLDAELYERISKMAKAERRSLANMTMRLLDEHPRLQAKQKHLNGQKADKATSSTV